VLLVQLLRFMQPYLRGAALNDAVRALYRGALRVLLVLLHDFPEFLCEHAFELCDVIPSSCIQARAGWQTVPDAPRAPCCAHSSAHRTCGAPLSCPFDRPSAHHSASSSPLQPFTLLSTL